LGPEGWPEAARVPRAGEGRQFECLELCATAAVALAKAHRPLRVGDGEAEEAVGCRGGATRAARLRRRGAGLAEPVNLGAATVQEVVQPRPIARARS
jgi:hypothetical protein